MESNSAACCTCVVLVFCSNCRLVLLARLPGMAVSKITKAAMNQECQMRIKDVCNGNPETTVWCHAIGSASGKGMGLKSPDVLGAFGCSACHDLYDRRSRLPLGVDRRDVEIAFHEAHQRSLRILIEKGLVSEK